MSNLVVVAIPAQDDYVWKISSEKIPHLTMLFLGEKDVGPKKQRMIDFLEHASKTSLDRFGLMVDHRGKLGPEEADVLFFNRHDVKTLENFQSSLLVNQEIAEAHLLATQYPEWTPHLTLGYPSTPAKIDTRDRPGIDWVFFDRIALWDGNYEGPTFQLKSRYDPGEVSMTTVDDILAHHGVKGMKWGVRNGSSGGSSAPPSLDSKQATAAQKKIDSHGVHSLSNEEIRIVLNRMSLEQQYSKINPQSSSFDKGHKFVRSTLGVGSTVNSIIAFVNSPAGKLIRKLLTGF